MFDGLVNGLYSIFKGGTAGQVWKKLGNGMYDMGWGNSTVGSKECNIKWTTPNTLKLTSGKLVLGKMYRINLNDNKFDLSYLGADNSMAGTTFIATAINVIDWGGLEFVEVSYTENEISLSDYPIGAISQVVSIAGGDDFQNLEILNSVDYNNDWLTEWYVPNTYYYFKEAPTTWVDGSTAVIYPCNLHITNTTGVTFNGYYINDGYRILAIVASEDIFDKLDTYVQFTETNRFTSFKGYSHAIINPRVLLLRCDNMDELNLCIKVA